MQRPLPGQRQQQIFELDLPTQLQLSFKGQLAKDARVSVVLAEPSTATVTLLQCLVSLPAAK